MIVHVKVLNMTITSCYIRLSICVTSMCYMKPPYLCGAATNRYNIEPSWNTTIMSSRLSVIAENYQAEYCDRVPECETQNCQSVGATAKCVKNIKDNPALAIFNRAYKRYHARVKVGSVKPDAFKKWQYEAVVMRDRCLGSEISIGEFSEWIDNYFG